MAKADKNLKEFYNSQGWHKKIMMLTTKTPFYGKIIEKQQKIMYQSVV